MYRRCRHILPYPRMTAAAELILRSYKQAGGTRRVHAVAPATVILLYRGVLHRGGTLWIGMTF